MDQITQTLSDKGIEIGLKLLGGLALWIVGRWLIGFSMKLVRGAFSKGKLEPTLQRYLTSVISGLLTVVLVVAILGYFGVETTTFAAVLAAAGVAIGMAWSGLLSNFAAGIFMVVLRPMAVGDFVTAGGVTGTVREIGLFVSVIDTLDGVRTIVGNNKIFSETIQNFSANPHRRVDLVAQLDHTVDVAKAVSLLQARVATIPNVTSDPAPEIDILEFTLAGPKLSVRPFCNNKDYWQVYFDTNKAIQEEFSKAAFPAPREHLEIKRQN